MYNHYIGQAMPLAENKEIKMKAYTIKLESGHFSGANEIMLTTERAESSYGQPVAVLVGGPNSGSAYGPSDVIPSAIENDPLPWLTEPAIRTVAAADISARAGGDTIDPAVIAFCGLTWE